jgi:hypothetical protein
MRVEKAPGTWEALSVPALLENGYDLMHGIRLVSPTYGETLKHGRPKPKHLLRPVTRQMTGRRTRAKEGSPTTIGSQISP